MIPLHLLPDSRPYVGMGDDLGNGPTELEPVNVRCRVEPKTKLITFAEGQTANASRFIILAPTITPQIGANLGGRRVLAVATMRLLGGQTRHHEVWTD